MAAPPQKSAAPVPPPTSIPSSAFFDLIIVGSGPSALSLVARLLERRPAALYTEEEHAHLSWLHRRSPPGHSPNKEGVTPSALLRTRKGGRRGNARLVVVEVGASESGRKGRKEAPGGIARILVVDKLGGWMRAWDNAFKAFDIRYLRSPLFWHPSPADRDGLLAYATLNGRAQVVEPADFVAAMRKGSDKGVTSGTKGRRRAAGKGSRAVSSSTVPLERRGSQDSTASSSSTTNSTSSSQQSSATSVDLTPSTWTSPPPLSAGLLEIAGCVGKELSKHKKRVRAAFRAAGPGAGQVPALRGLGGDVNERDRRDYHAAATGLFSDFVRYDVVERYGLEGEDAWQEVKLARERWEKEELDGEAFQQHCNAPAPRAPTLCIDSVKSSVHSLRWTDLELEGAGSDGDSFMGFSVQLDDGVVVGGKSVVLAVGPSGGRANVPVVISGAAHKREERDSSSPQDLKSEVSSTAGPVPPSPTHGPGWAHTSALASPSFPFPSPPPTSSTKPSTLVVIGGGLTSAQICDLGVRRGFQKVVLLLRGHMKVKPFDVGLEWLGRYSNIKKMQFWQEELASSRLAMIRAARQGGSITPVYADILRSHVADGKVEIREHTSIAAASYGGEEGWKLELERADAPTSTISNGVLQAAYIVTATGAAPSILDLPLLEHIKGSHPIPTEGGLPLITEDLQWREDLPLFVVGGFSALQIGPGAGNLGGMQEAADRVALKLSDLFLAAGAAAEGGRSIGDVLPSMQVRVKERCSASASVTAEKSAEGDNNGTEGGKGRMPRHGRTAREKGCNKGCDRSHRVDSVEQALSNSTSRVGRAAGEHREGAKEEQEGEEEEEEEEQDNDAYARSSFPHFGFHSLAVEG